jgi:2,3-bisphosphoglycerate-independent phosphoglycerate mutase
MDRDRRWERTERAYRAIVRGEGAQVRSAEEAIAAAHAADETDEFVQPQVVVDDAGSPEGVLRPEDGVIFFNFRADRARQLVRALGLEDFDHFERDAGTFDLVTLTRYDDTFPFDVRPSRRSRWTTSWRTCSMRTASPASVPRRRRSTRT